MGKYAKYERPEFKRPWRIHPIWRGLGCFIVIIIPVISVAGAIKLAEVGSARGWPIPPQLLGRIQFPAWVWRVPFLSDFAWVIHSINNLLAIIIFSVVLFFLLSGIITTLYAVLYRMVGPPRYTRIDAPPPRRKARRYRR